MNDDQVAFLQRLVETTGPSGYEAAAQAVWCDRVRDAAASLTVDALGNAIAVMNPDGRPRVMIEGHVDEIGFQVKHIDENGYLYFHPIGGFDPTTLAGNRVRIQGTKGPVLGVIGRKPVHLVDPEERKRAPELKSMWIDIGVGSREEAEALLAVGDAGGRAAGMERLQGNLVTSNSLDDRVGCYVAAETFRALAGQTFPACLLAVSSVQEEIGLRGARVSSYTANADIGIALEVTWTSDHPESSKTELGDIRVGGGPTIFRGVNTNPHVFERLVAAAEAEGVPYQVDVYASGSPTDGKEMQVSRSGMAVCIMSVPTRYLHTQSEVTSLADIDATVTILTRFVRDLDASVDLTP
jgi:tetrahedral aminopeptidase